MIKFLRILTVVCLALFFIVLGCNNPNIDKEEGSLSIVEDSLSSKVDEYFSALAGLWKFNGVVCVEKSGSSILLNKYECNPDGLKEMGISIDSQFDIHSVSKLMAKYLLFMLEEQGKLHRSDTLVKYFPDFPKGDEITLEMLIHHSSGLPREIENVNVDLINLEKEEIIEFIKRQKLLFSPGSDEQYSNLGYQLLYFVIGDVCGKSFEQVLNDEVFLPLGMTQSGAHFYSDSGKPLRLASNHIDNDGRIQKVENILPDEFKQARIYSTAEDLMAFLRHIKSSPLNLDLVQGNGLIGHSGGSDGIRTHVVTNVEEDYSYVFLSNFDGIPFLKITEDLEKIMKGEPYDLPVLINRKSILLVHEKLEKYVGDYRFPDMNNLELKIILEDDGLHLIQEGEDIACLKAETETVFFDDPSAEESFEFVLNEQGTFDVLMGWKGGKLKGTKLNVSKN